MSDDEDRPDEDEPLDAPTAEDNYKKLGHEKQVGDLVNLVDVDLDLVNYTDEWWTAHEKRVAEARAQNVAADERMRMRKRAIGMAEHEGHNMCGRFPERLIQQASHVTGDTSAMRAARLFAHTPSLILVLAGGVGVGKSTSAVWAELKSEDRSPGFIRAAELERRGRYDKKLDEWIRERTSLVIDDLGAEVLDGKGVFRSLLDETVDQFYSARKPLIITTNLRPRITDEDRAAAGKEGREVEPQFVERYGERVRSRVKQLGQWVDCGMVDLRSEP